MKIRSFGISHPGMVRERNEDNFLCEEGEGIFVVADGMGGLAKGKMASQIAVDTVKNFIKGSRTGTVPWPFNPREGLSQEEGRLLAAVTLANEAIFQEFLNGEDHRPMGTTLTGLLVDGLRVVVCNIGDSRLYRVRSGMIELLTEDHSWVMEEVKRGELTWEQAMNHPQKHVLTRALGTCECAEVDIFSREVQNGDIYLLCSDGLSDTVADREMLSLLESCIEEPLGGCGERLIAAANHHGGRDNITAVLVRLDE